MSLPLQGGSDEGRTPRLLILTARREDYEPLLADGDFETRLHQNHPYQYRETPTGNLRLTHLGMGTEEAEKTLRSLEGMIDPDFVLIAGSAGALKSDLSVGNVFLPTAVSGPEHEHWLHPPSDSLRWTMGTLQQSDEDFEFRSGPLVTSREPVLQPTDREQLHEETGALAVDMETAVLVESLVESEETPPFWSVIRVISDTFEQESFDAVKQRQDDASETVARVLDILIEDLR